MKARPILFNGDMVKAILDGRKTQTRRPIKKPENPYYDHLCDISTDLGYGASRNNVWAGFGRAEDPAYFKCPFGKPGDILYVRETFRCNGWATDLATIFYKANENNSYTEMCEQFPVAGKKPLPVSNKWTPSIHMPRWASRLTLEITDIRMERVQDITEDDCQAEGLKLLQGGIKSEFMVLWHSIYDNWYSNPWVWIVEFKVIHANVDEVLKKEG